MLRLMRKRKTAVEQDKDKSEEVQEDGKGNLPGTDSGSDTIDEDDMSDDPNYG